MIVPSNKPTVMPKPQCPSSTLPSQSIINSSGESHNEKLSPLPSSQSVNLAQEQEEKQFLKSDTPTQLHQTFVSSCQKYLSEKPVLKKKPLPPPRAPSTSKANGTVVNVTVHQEPLAKEKNEKENDEETVSCGLCGADVGIKPALVPSKVYPKSLSSREGSSNEKAKLGSTVKQVVNKLEGDLEKKAIEREGSETSYSSTLPKKD